jgi:hypothetical protein
LPHAPRVFSQVHPAQSPRYECCGGSFCDE